jgi:uncharacterized damage-inducible protein DinB
MNNTSLAQVYLSELQAEATTTRRCLERIPESTYDFKPHPKSMNMGYLVLLVAEIPLWIKYVIDEGEIDFATFKHQQPKNSAEMLAHYEENLFLATEALKNATEDKLKGDFSLKTKGQLLFSSPIIETIGTTINHWVHHRGQLTVYMRLNDILVPSIYGPSADEKQYAGQA